MTYEESIISFLSTSAAIAPLLVFFVRYGAWCIRLYVISEQQSADIATVAPVLPKH